MLKKRYKNNNFDRKFLETQNFIKNYEKANEVWL